MLNEIRNCIQNIPNVNFEDFYQTYVKHMQDSILDYKVKQSSALFTNIEDTTEILRGLNVLTEELKKL